MQITLSYVQSFALSALKTAQREFNKNPSSTNFEVLTRAMVTHQQAQHVARVLRSQDNVDLMLEQLSALPLGDWPDLIVKRATGLTIRDVLTAA
jgi:hypothetical protein